MGGSYASLHPPMTKVSTWSERSTLHRGLEFRDSMNMTMDKRWQGQWADAIGPSSIRSLRRTSSRFLSAGPAATSSQRAPLEDMAPGWKWLSLNMGPSYQHFEVPPRSNRTRSSSHHLFRRNVSPVNSEGRAAAIRTVMQSMRTRALPFTQADQRHHHTRAGP
ncbi:hypothetical protein CERSUDRAFT_114632 [Gelatoporia subvermispora B]|uniref:Uncharacterized protein n=1 Tax=Ceriporiopsis subvermispora (strain B) TaxID=914234 RepID=M2PK67_CERS8|nr:hypothetical protein CERSUDRAFT_114632 [Gelatoporia subvermispora B]